MPLTWRAVFFGEVGALSILCAFWLIWPGQHVAWLVGSESAAPELQLVEHAAAAVLFAWTFFYGALLLRRSELETLRLVQQALALGSILLLAVGFGLWQEGRPGGNALLLAHLGALTCSLLLRGAFLARTREPVLVLETN